MFPDIKNEHTCMLECQDMHRHNCDVIMLSGQSHTHTEDVIQLDGLIKEDHSVVSLFYTRKYLILALSFGHGAPQSFRSKWIANIWIANLCYRVGHPS